MRLTEVALNSSAHWSVYEYGDSLDTAVDDFVDDDLLDDGAVPWGSPGISKNSKYNTSRIAGYRPYHQRTESATPVVTKVDPSHGTFGTLVHIYGGRFAPNASLTGVAIGGAECAVKV